MSLTEDFYRQSNRIVLDALRKGLVEFPPFQCERERKPAVQRIVNCPECGTPTEVRNNFWKRCVDCAIKIGRERKRIYNANRRRAK